MNHDPLDEEKTMINLNDSDSSMGDLGTVGRIPSSGEHSLGELPTTGGAMASSTSEEGFEGKALADRYEDLEEIAKATRDLAFAEEFLNEEGISFETHQLARGKSPGEDLVSFAEENDIDQLFVGIEKRSRTQKIILGSNAQYMILKAPCPVVSVNQSSR